MNLNTALRLVALTGPLFTSTLAAAQEAEPVTYKGAVSVGLSGNTFSSSDSTPPPPIIALDMERRIDGTVTFYGGPSFGVDTEDFRNVLGAHLGGRYFLSEQIHDGMFVSLQGEVFIFSRGDSASGHRLALSGLVGYAQPIGEEWVVSLGAGMEGSLMSTEVVVGECHLFVCNVGTTTEFERAVQPHVRAGATFRF
ncbi:hypothetical protein [Myxococcus landrumensis]|uniref:Outer membrane protein beta-barrel domain-containing protein n=1 Tax=Myxococcus landrumensis TaxID=2813577 RepID=A0ABX7NDT0_9BACT|nr:hypothetical protein [Myxococcus landrumus]QSQ15757.1 hypothetical protein JY572_06760 [Myxococcus landrumus]